MVSRVLALFIGLAFLAVPVSAAPKAPAMLDGPTDLLRPGDLIYIALKGTAGGAISDASGSIASHIGVISQGREGQVTVIHSYGRVKEEPLARFLSKGTGPWSANRLLGQGEAESAELVAGARRFLGWPYDRKYRIDNRELYCSELIYRAYLDQTKQIPVPLSPMDFASAGEEVWNFWVRFFQGDVPQGEPGISPGEYLESPDFQMIHHGLLEERLAPIQSRQSHPQSLPWSLQ